MATNRQQNLDKVGAEVKKWNENPVRPVYISPNDRRAPGQVTNAPATPNMAPAPARPRMLSQLDATTLNYSSEDRTEEHSKYMVYADGNPADPQAPYYLFEWEFEYD